MSELLSAAQPATALQRAELYGNLQVAQLRDVEQGGEWIASRPAACVVPGAASLPLRHGRTTYWLLDDSPGEAEANDKDGGPPAAPWPHTSPFLPLLKKGGCPCPLNSFPPFLDLDLDLDLDLFSSGGCPNPLSPDQALLAFPAARSPGRGPDQRDISLELHLLQARRCPDG